MVRAVVTGEVSDEQLVEAVRGWVEQELALLGQRAALRTEGAWLVLGKGATQTRAEVQGTLEQWQGMPDDLRQRRSRQLAELLLAKPANAPVVARPQRLSNRPRWYSVIAPLLVVLATGLALLVAHRLLAPNGGATWAKLSELFGGSAPASAASENLKREPAAPVISPCDQVRARVARGASIGPADVDGWEVELVLLRRGAPEDLSHAPALSAFLRPKSDSTASTWVWPNAKSLILTQRFDAQVAVHALPALGSGQLSGVRFVFSGPYVTPYFSEELRSDYLLLADALADALRATDGALFAHCANPDAHSIGSWFLGATPGAALGSLVYFMAGYSDLPVLKPEVLGSGDEATRRGQAFDTINKATAGVDRAKSATLLGRELGMISGRPHMPSRLTFPFRDANRAQRSSLDVARAMGLTADR
ncbi:MAG: hypothetical protein ABUL62_19645 [Myxococcales bacterium]